MELFAEYLYSGYVWDICLQGSIHMSGLGVSILIRTLHCCECAVQLVCVLRVCASLIGTLCVVTEYRTCGSHGVMAVQSREAHSSSSSSQFDQVLWMQCLLCRRFLSTICLEKPTKTDKSLGLHTWKGLHYNISAPILPGFADHQRQWSAVAPQAVSWMRPTQHTQNQPSQRFPQLVAQQWARAWWQVQVSAQAGKRLSLQVAPRHMRLPSLISLHPRPLHLHLLLKKQQKWWTRRSRRPQSRRVSAAVLFVTLQLWL